MLRQRMAELSAWWRAYGRWVRRGLAGMSVLGALGLSGLTWYVGFAPYAAAKCFLLEDDERAIYDCGQVLQATEPRLVAPVLLKRGERYLAVGFSDAAIRDAQTLLAEAPDRVDALMLLANGYRQTNSPALAEEVLTQVLDLDPGNALAYAWRCAAYDVLKRYDAALADCGRALALNNLYWLAHMSRASVFFELEDYEAALRDLNRTIKLLPDAEGALVLRSSAHCRLGNRREALRDMARAVQVERVTWSDWTAIVYRHGFRESPRFQGDYPALFITMNNWISHHCEEKRS
ncbi:MAG: tetratricopeptide repeat protein [Pseudomonadota bacterium]